MSLQGKVAIVTGGNSGIGKAIALGLARAGAGIVIDYIAHPEATEALEHDIAALGDVAIGVDADVSSVPDLQRLVDAAVAKFGRLDIMVNNAGMETPTSVLDTTEQQYTKVLDINLKSAFFGTQIAAKQMIRQGSGGSIINLGGLPGAMGSLAYGINDVGQAVGYSVLGSVPESSTWAMMLLGFGVVGGVMRTRRQPLTGHRALNTQII